MYNQSCGYQNNFSTQRCHHGKQSCDCQNNFQSLQDNNGMNQTWNWNNNVSGCPRPQPLVAPRRVCVSQQITPVAQPVICPVECRRVNRCMYYPVFYPQYEQTCVNMPY